MWVLFLYTRILFNVLNFKTWRQSSLGTFTYNNELNLTVWHIGCFQTKCRQYIYCIYISLEYRGKTQGKLGPCSQGKLCSEPSHNTYNMVSESFSIILVLSLQKTAIQERRQFPSSLSSLRPPSSWAIHIPYWRIMYLQHYRPLAIAEMW